MRWYAEGGNGRERERERQRERVKELKRIEKTSSDMFDPIVTLKVKCGKLTVNV